MEFKRSYLRNVIAFYFTLHLPTIQTIDDALRLWSNKFQGSKLKAVIQLAAELFATRNLDFMRPQDKPKALQALGLYIMRQETKLRRKFIDVSRDSTRCTRAVVSFKVELTSMTEGFRQFVEDFDDVETCRSKCRIDHFILTRYRAEVERYVKQAAQLPRNNDTRGFLRIAENLSEILKKGADVCTCQRCERIGDVVIALDAPRDMQLEHTDNSWVHYAKFATLVGAVPPCQPL